MAKQKPAKKSGAPPKPASAGNANKPQPRLGGKAWAWLRTHWWAGVIAVAAAVAYPALNAIGTSAGNGVVSTARHAFSSAGPSHKTAPSAPLAATTVVSYSDAQAVALQESVTSGTGYDELVSGLSDIGSGGNSWGSFLASHPGAPLGRLHTDITLIGLAKSGVRVTNIQIERVGPPRAPMSGTYIPIQHAGGQAAYTFSANMDSANPVLTRVPSGQTFPDFNVELSQGDQVTLAVDFLAAHYSSAWNLYVTYLVGARTGHIEIEAPNNHPFAVTAAAHSYKTSYISNYPMNGYSLKH
jgi:hypothetical protein